jgi:hypothetical protein
VIPLARWVAPFGDPGIAERSPLPRAFRSVLRPSSPLSAKASTRCPSHALPAPNGKNHREVPGCASNPCPTKAPAPGPSPEVICGPLPRRRGQTLSRRHFVAEPRRPALRPGTRFCYGHTTRFFTIVISAAGPAPTARRRQSLRLAAASPDHKAPTRCQCGNTRSDCQPITAVLICPLALCPLNMEVTGLEPATSCLQSRRSPS